MSLIKCIECGGMVSSKATACPHCGYPMNYGNTSEQDMGHMNMCTINGVPVDITEVLQYTNTSQPEKLKAISVFRELTGCGLASAKSFVETLMTTNRVPTSVSIPDAKISSGPKMRCPTCGSTNIEQINLSTRAAATVLFGVVSKTARSQFHCKNCGYKW